MYILPQDIERSVTYLLFLEICPCSGILKSVKESPNFVFFIQIYSASNLLSYQVVIAQWLARPLASKEVHGSNPGKGKNLLISDLKGNIIIRI